jgi:hypothetical protein
MDIKGLSSEMALAGRGLNGTQTTKRTPRNKDVDPNMDMFPESAKVCKGSRRCIRPYSSI